MKKEACTKKFTINNRLLKDPVIFRPQFHPQYMYNALTRTWGKGWRWANFPFKGS